MPNKTISPSIRGQARNTVDVWAELLRDGKAPSLDMLLALVPDEPSMDVEDFDWCTPLPMGTRVIVLSSWAATKLSENVPVIKYRGAFIPMPGDVLVTRNGCHKIVQSAFPKRALALCKKFPGVQLSYHYREARKYNMPHGEPVIVWVRELLTTARMHWSRAVEAYGNGWGKYGLDLHCTNLPFKDWLPGYMMNKNWYEGCSDPGDLGDEAAQIVRLACGLPRFAPNRRVSRRARLTVISISMRRAACPTINLCRP